MENIAKTASRVLDAATKSVKSGSTRQMPSLKNISVEKIFLTFARRHTHRWTIAHDDKLARQLWWRDLAEAKITDDEVISGLKTCKSCKWPPSVGEFIEYCKHHSKPVFYISLPPPEVNKRKVKTLIKKMKKSVGILPK